MYSEPLSEIRVKVESHEGWIHIVVEDNGPGIPAEHLPRLFEKFYRIPGSRTGGTGLGLSIVKSIVDLHKGHISVEAAEPQGARFIIALPKLAQPHLPQEAKDTATT